MLAHLFVDFMLDPENAKLNFAWNGYLPPLTGLEPDYSIGEGWRPQT